MTNDLISREAAIAVLEKLICNGDEDYDIGHDKAISNAIEALTNMPSAESELQEEIADLRNRLELWQYEAQYQRD